MKETPWSIHRTSPTHLDCKGTKVYISDGIVNWTWHLTRYLFVPPEVCRSVRKKKNQNRSLLKSHSRITFEVKHHRCSRRESCNRSTGISVISYYTTKRHNSFSLDPFVCWNQMSLEWIFSLGFTSVVELACCASLFIYLPSSSHRFPVPLSCWIQNQPASSKLCLSSFPAMPCLYNKLISYCAWTDVVLFNFIQVIYLKKHLNLMTS